MADDLKRNVRRVLLELVISDLVGMARHALEWTSYQDGRPADAFEPLALAIRRLDELGGLEALNRELWRADRGERAPARTPDGCGASRPASVTRPRRTQ